IRTVHSGLKFIPPSVSKSLAGRPPHSELSGREMQVLELIVNGRSNKEIGDALHISEATVKWHVNMILSRLNVSDRTQATEPAFRDDSVYCLYTSRDGTLWIGTEGGGLMRYAGGKFRTYGAAEGLTNGFVRVIFEARDGTLWVGTDDGLFRMDRDSLARVDG